MATYNDFERRFAEFLNRARDVRRFAALRITEQGNSGTSFRVDYLKASGCRTEGTNRSGAAECHIERLRTLRFVTDNDHDDRQTIALARRHGLSGYDVAYLETAKRRGAKLAALDKKLAAAATEESVSINGD